MNTIEFNGWSLLKLVYALRAIGIQVSIQEIQEAVRVLSLFPNIDSKIAIQSVFIHREEDKTHFELVWQLLFIGLRIESKDESKSDATLNCLGLGTDKDGNSEFSQGIGTGNGGITIHPGLSNCQNNSTDELFKMPDIKSYSQIKGFPSEINELKNLEELDFEEQVKFILGQSGFLSWSNSQELAYSNGVISEENWNSFNEQRNLLELNTRYQLWNLKIEKENSWNSLKNTSWRYKALDKFTPQEENIIHQALRQMGKKLASRPGWRKRIGNRGAICLSTALKEIVRGNGYIYHLEFEKSVLQRPELIVLCDVSNSIAPYSQFLLYLIRRIKARFRRVRIYLFIDTIWDISNENWVEERDSIEQIKSWSHKKTSGFTDYGIAFKEFFQNFLPETSARATLLILGDARNNYRPSQVEYFIGIAEKVRRVYWLNPLIEKEWHNPDNIMRDYTPYCTKTFRCRTIEDLLKIANEVF